MTKPIKRLESSRRKKFRLDDEMENELFRVHRLIKSDVLSKAKLLE